MDDPQLSYLRFILALVLVLGLIALLAYVARRLGLAARTTGMRAGRRLAISEILAVDARRRLVLFRRDDVEHLILLGATQDLLIETLPRTKTPPHSES